MAYTQAQLEAAFKNAAIGTTPTAAQSLTLQALATQNASGQLTDAQALAQTVSLAANSTTDVSVGAYQFFLGFSPSVAGLTALNAAYTGTGAQAGLNGENRFIAQSISLATQNATAKAAFSASYGTLSIADATKAAYNIIIGNPAATAAGINIDAAVAYLSSAASVTYYTNFVKANVPGLSAADLDLAVKAAIVGEIMFIADGYNNGAGLGSYAAATNNLVTDLADDGKLTADNAAGINLFTAYPAPSTSTVFALTAGTDNLPGTAGNDTFNGLLGINPGTGIADVATLTALDTISGGTGVDTLNYEKTGAIASVPGTITGVEIINVTGDAAVTVDASNFTGLTTLNAKGGGAVALTTKGNATSASISGAGVTTAAFTDSATGADTLASVTVSNATGAITVTSDALTSLTLNAANGGATVTAAAGTRALGVTLNGVTGGTIADAEATGLTVTTTGVKSSGVTLNAAKATTVTIAADETLGVTDVNIAAATKLVVTGDSLVTIAAASTVTALTSIDSSASTGGVKFTPALGTGVLFTGGEGKDTISVGATTKAITTGGGNDTVTFTGAVGTGGTIDGGTGTDTLIVDAATYATTTKVTGFETLGLGASAAGAFDATGFTGLAVSGGIAGASSFTNVAAGTGLTISAAPGFGVSVVLADATGTADVQNVTLSSAATIAANTLTLAGIETVNITATDTDTSTANIDTLTLVATGAKVLNVSGNAGLNLTNTGNTALKTFDAHLSTGDITYVSAATTGSTTITGSATGVNSLTGGVTADTITGGAKDDTIVSSTGLDILTGGGGNDTYTLVANTNGNIYATITDANKGDVLTFANLGTETFATAKVSLAGTAVFQDYLNEAAKGVGNVNAAISWFQFGGDTYVVEDLSAATSFVNGTDIVVKLTGLVDLSTATGAGTHIITLG